VRGYEGWALGFLLGVTDVGAQGDRDDLIAELAAGDVKFDCVLTLTVELDHSYRNFLALTSNGGHGNLVGD